MKLIVKLRKKNDLLLKHLLLEYTYFENPNVDEGKYFDKDLFNYNLMCSRSFSLQDFYYYNRDLVNLNYIGIERHVQLNVNQKEYEVFEVVGGFETKYHVNRLTIETFYSKKDAYNYLINAMTINKYAKCLAKTKGLYRKRKMRWLFR
jgi:hypothetical protein